MAVAAVVPEIVLVVGAVLVLLWSLFTSPAMQKYAAVIATATVAASAYYSASMLDGKQDVAFFGTYATDGAAIWARLIILAATLVTIAFSTEWFRNDPRHGEYYTLLLMSALGAVLLAGAADLMEMLVGTLLSSATGYVLAAYHRASARSAEAGIKYYLLGALTNGGMAYGAVLLFGLAGTTLFSGLPQGLAGAAGPALVAGTALVAVGLAFKIGAVPAHAWVPDVADGAPAPVAAFLTVVPKVGALVALGRLALVIPDTAVGWRPLVAALAAVTMTLGNLAALWQDDVRRLLGWSTVSQAGYALMAVTALGRSNLALESLLYFLVAYTLANLAAFGVVIELRGLADRNGYAGLARAHPMLAMSLLLAFLSLIGIPPLAGFPAKLALFGAAMDSGYGWLAVVAAVNTAVSVAYYLRVLGPVYFEDPLARPAPVLGVRSGVTAGLCAFALLAAGIAAQPLMALFGTSRLLPGLN